MEDISKSLGIEHEIEEDIDVGEIVKFEPNAVQPTNQDLIDDYTFARKTLRDLIERGQESLLSAIKLNAESPGPRNIEVTATLINQISGAAKDLLALSKTAKEITGNDNKKIAVDLDDIVGDNNNSEKTIELTAEDLSEMLKDDNDVN